MSKVNSAVSEWITGRSLTARNLRIGVKAEYNCVIHATGKAHAKRYIERFNRTFRENILYAHLFEDINQVLVLADEWMEDYNYSRPHEALGGITPDLHKRLNCGDIENSGEFPTSPQFQ
ncbi:transposase [Mucilaginibacter daejeonensis]|uniref:integrase core domain-containing protein n=1 Tax=Mucilaginibacter daejeonensis TaxID=398049 RepID=UPI001D17446E|nr:transposase [Mucilaginibacter daejeonensis]UEG54028.1 transposase [Mucilaginibacter daejeonensis]